MLPFSVCVGPAYHDEKQIKLEIEDEIKASQIICRHINTVFILKGLSHKI